MTAQVSSIPVSIDYTSRDFYALREDLIQLVKERVNVGGASTWTGEDANDFGVALIEAFSYIGDITNYYIDRIANEAYLPTATQRKNVLNLARLYGYVPTGYRSAEVELTLTNTREDTEEEDGVYVLPAGSQVSGTVVCDNTVEEVIFTTLAEVAIPANDGEINGTVTVAAYHGELASTRTGGTAQGELLGTSTGLANQFFTLAENQVVDGSLTVYVENGDIFEPWTQVPHISDYGPFDAVYEVRLDENNFVTVVFGDGVSGSVPNRDERISVEYIIGGGTIGNVPTGTLTTLNYIPDVEEVSLVADFISVTNAVPALGGSEPESTPLIRTNSVQALRASNKVVSLSDYADLALSQTNVGKAQADAEVWSSVNVYVAPVRAIGDKELYPGYDSSGENLTTEWDDLESSVSAYFVGKIQIGTTVSILPPSYTPIQIDVSYVAADQFTSAQVEESITNELLLQYSYSNLDFAAVLTPEDIEKVLSNLSSVRNVRVTALYRYEEGAVVERAALVGEPGEIFIFGAEPGRISLTQESSVATLSNNASISALTSSSGTFSPTFASGTYYYDLNSVATNTIVLTPTVSAGATVSYIVNGTAQTSSTISTPTSATTIIHVQVTSGDGSSVKSYVLKVVRA